MRDAQIQRGRRKKRFDINPVPIMMAIIIVLLVVIAVLLVKNASDKKKAAIKSSSAQSAFFSSQAALASSQKAVNAALAMEADKWYLKLANKDNPLQDNFSPDVSVITAKYTSRTDMKFDSRAVVALNSMCAAADKDGVSLLIISSYRTITKQTQLFNTEIANQKVKHPGYSEEQARTAAATVVAVPGTSEHNIGLAVDFSPDQESFETSSQSAWLRTHAAQYGFVMRYPKGKSDITGIIYEPWHYRYVGVEHAKRMNEKGLCLEEYLNYLHGLR